MIKQLSEDEMGKIARLLLDSTYESELSVDESWMLVYLYDSSLREDFEAQINVKELKK
jgi:hypothetical protein